MLPASCWLDPAHMMVLSLASSWFSWMCNMGPSTACACGACGARSAHAVRTQCMVSPSGVGVQEKSVQVQRWAFPLCGPFSHTSSLAGVLTYSGPQLDGNQSVAGFGLSPKAIHHHKSR